MRATRWMLSLYLGGAVLAGCGGSPMPVAAQPTIDRPAAPDGMPIAPTATRSAVGLWVSAPSTNQILGLSKSGKKTIETIDTSANGCYGPTGLKVSRTKDLFVACDSAYGGSCYGACVGLTQTYAPGSRSPAITYVDSMQAVCSRSSHVCVDYAESNDVAFDAAGHVFAANLFTLSCSRGHSGIHCSPAGGAYTWWDAGDSYSAHIAISNLYKHYFFYYLDVDAVGNLYVDGAPYYGSGGFQVYEVTDPTSASWVMTALTAPTNDRLGGVYVSNGGSVLNVVDETARTISQYALPWVASETPFNVLGPTLQQMGKGQPISGGFDRSEKHLALADADGWVDLGTVAGNKWTKAAKKELGTGAFGAAYSPSDK